MIVIKHGKTYKKITCQCQAVLGYTDKDIKKDFKTHEYGGKYHTIEKTYITCPECKKQICLQYLVDGKETV